MTKSAARTAEIDVAMIKATDAKSLSEITGFASSNRFPSPFQSGEMFAVYSRTKGCKPIAFVAKDEENGILASLVATTFMDAGISFGTLVSHVACRGGPLFVPGQRGKECGILLLRGLLEAVQAESLYTRVYPLFDYQDQFALLNRLGFSRENWLNFLIDLTPGEQPVWDGMNRYRRKGVRKAERAGIQVVDASTNDEVDAVHALVFESHARAKTPMQDKSLFEAVFRILVPNRLARMVIAYHGEEPVSARIILTHCHIIYDWYAGTAAAGNEQNANEFLVWSVMQWGCRNGFKLFDFGGAGTPGEDYGPREFKRLFGGMQTNFGRYTVVHKPKILKLVKSLNEVRRRI